MKKTTKVFAALLVLGGVTGARATVVWTDNFDTDTSANYDVTKFSTVVIGGDSKAVFNFDYGQAWPYDDFGAYTGTTATHWNLGAAIPQAPTGSGNKGMYFRVNEDQGENTSIDEVHISPKGLHLWGDYTMTVDAWYEVTASGTSTQLSLFGADYRAPYFFSQETVGPGNLFSYTGDGSSTQDYRMYIGSKTQLSAVGNGGFQATAGSGTGTQPKQNNNNTYYTNYFTAPTFKYPGSPGDAWVKLRVSRVGDRVQMGITKPGGGPELLINDVESKSWRNGTPMIGMWDPAGSPRPADQPLFMVYDNLVVDGTLGQLVSGHVNFLDLSETNTFATPQRMDGEVWSADGSTKIGDTTVILTTSGASAGDFTVVAPVGNYLVKFDYSHWLTKGVIVDTTAGPVTDVVVDLTNGDCDGNNIINTDDYLILSEHFDTVYDPFDLNNGFDPRADLNEDDIINTDDYLILSTNFDISGD